MGEWIIGIVVVVLLLWIVGTYNRLIVLRNRINNAWAQIDVQLKRRYDLIPNLIETVKGYAKHEKTTLTEVTKMRANLIKGTPEKRMQASNMIADALKSVFAVAENYPKLQANENFLKLQEELAGTEDKISYVRTAYNDDVLRFANMKQQFPSSIIANMFGFQEKKYLEAPEAERKAVKVKFE